MNKVRKTLAQFKGVVWLNLNPEAPNRGYWDQSILEDLFAGLNHFTEIGGLKEAIVIVPAQQNVGYIEEINKEISRLDSLIFILTGDEANIFDIDLIEHPRIYKIEQYSHGTAKTVDYYIPCGYTPHSRSNTELPVKEIDAFFAGQVTHEDRKNMVKYLKSAKKSIDRLNIEIIETKGFTQGLDPGEYIEKMRRSKTVPCPSGNTIIDSFRVYEALENGAIPIVSPDTAVNRDAEYFNRVGVKPATIKWESLAGYIDYASTEYSREGSIAMSDWLLRKASIRRIFETHEHLEVLIPTSAIGSHPDTSIIESTIRSIRQHLPEATIHIMCDGLSPKLGKYKDRYQEYLRRLVWKCNYEWEYVVPWIFEDHKHQSGMTKKILQYVNSDWILFVEHDTPLSDEHIPFDELIKNDKYNLIRFLHEARIIDEHRYMHLDQEPKGEEIKFIRTAQWSQRPHLAKTEYYRNIMTQYFSEDTRSMIEDRMHGIVYNDYKLRGQGGWNLHRLAIYAPDGNLQRSHHLDGRGKDSKFEEDFLY